MSGSKKVTQELRSAVSSANQAMRAIGNTGPSTQSITNAFNHLVAAIQNIDERLVELEEKADSTLS